MAVGRQQPNENRGNVRIGGAFSSAFSAAFDIGHETGARTTMYAVAFATFSPGAQAAFVEVI